MLVEKCQSKHETGGMFIEGDQNDQKTLKINSQF